jgi:hypothetical protein
MYSKEMCLCLVGGHHNVNVDIMVVTFPFIIK